MKKAPFFICDDHEDAEAEMESHRLVTRLRVMIPTGSGPAEAASTVISGGHLSSL